MLTEIMKLNKIPIRQCVIPLFLCPSSKALFILSPHIMYKLVPIDWFKFIIISRCKNAVNS